jgi:hypothetical protein
MTHQPIRDQRPTPELTARAERPAPTRRAGSDPRQPPTPRRRAACRAHTRRGHAKATVATAHKILTAAYHVLNQGVAYHELGEEFFYRRHREHRATAAA